MQTETGPEKTAVVAKSKYCAGLPTRNPIGGMTPVLAMVRVVIPACVTLLKTSFAGEAPVLSVG